MQRKMMAVMGAAALIVMTSAFSMREVIFDAATGTGFVGKGDVQLVFGLNNKQLQDAAEAIQFRATSEVVTEVSWTCTNSNNQNTQERERTTTTSVAGVVSSTARVRNQVTGFNLSGYVGLPTQSSTSEGNQLNSCPTHWILTPAGDPAVISNSTLFQVSLGGGTWTNLQ